MEQQEVIKLGGDEGVGLVDGGANLLGWVGWGRRAVGRACGQAGGSQRLALGGRAGAGGMRAGGQGALRQLTVLFSRASFTRVSMRLTAISESRPLQGHGGTHTRSCTCMTCALRAGKPARVRRHMLTWSAHPETAHGAT